VAALVLIAPAVLAARLTPDPRGWGTHEQLGWAPCRIRQWWDRPCPTCGMTTSWAYAARGNALAAVRTNAGGALMWMAVTASAVWLGAMSATGRRLGWPPAPRVALAVATAWLVVTLLDWLRRLNAG
jgi:hypothetical protein